MGGWATSVPHTHVSDAHSCCCTTTQASPTPPSSLVLKIERFKHQQLNDLTMICKKKLFDTWIEIKCGSLSVLEEKV